MVRLPSFRIDGRRPRFPESCSRRRLGEWSLAQCGEAGRPIAEKKAAAADGRWGADRWSYHAAMKRALLIFALWFPLVLHARERGLEWRDTYESRLEILALLQSLNGEILAASSATRTLEAWCGQHQMAEDPKIVARRVSGVRREPTAEQLQRLGVHDASEVQYRRVELRCGVHLLSEADNWYVPARLTPEMNALLTTTEIPFGKVVQAFQPYRRTIAVTMLWTPLPRGWEQQRRPRLRSRRWRLLAIPKEVFQHRAVLYTSDHRPFAEVVETYQSELLAFRR